MTEKKKRTAVSHEHDIPDELPEPKSSGLKATLEAVSSIQQKVVVEAPAAEVEKARKAAIDKVRKEAKVPGFRAGKMPDILIEKRFGEDLEAEAVRAVVRATYPQAIAQVEAHPIGDPRVEPKGRLHPGKPFSYEATFEIYPEVVAKGYEKLSLEREKSEVAEDEIEGELARLQRQMTQLEPVEGAAVGPGMVALIDFKGTADGKPFAGSEAENYVVEYGAGGLLQDFEVQIEGMKGGEERAVSFTYPADYFKKEIAGKKGEFSVKVREVRRKVVPELDAEFAKTLGDFADMNAVRRDLREKIAAFKEQSSTAQLREQAIRQIIEKHKEIEVPMTLIDAELGNMLEQLRRQLEAQGRTLEEAKINAQEFVQANLSEATDRARGYMLINAIAKQEGVEVADEELTARIETIAKGSHKAPAAVRQHFEKNNLLNQLKGQILFEKTLDLVLGKAKIKEKKAEKKKK